LCIFLNTKTGSVVMFEILCSKYVSQEMSNKYGIDILSLIKYSSDLLGNIFSLSRL
jgi:hypothetical protein